MARTVAGLPEGTRVTDFISLGVVATRFPAELIHRILKDIGKESQRQRQLPAHVVVYYVIALALFMNVSYSEVLRCLMEGLSWLGFAVDRIRATGPSGISQARSRLGWEPMRALFDEVARPLAVVKTQGAFYRDWRLVSIDGTSLDLADTRENESRFSRPGASRGKSAFPQLRFCGLMECGTHALFAVEAGPSSAAELTQASALWPRLTPGMLCLADRGFFSFRAWQQAHQNGAELLWRAKSNAVLPCERRLTDGSYLSTIFDSPPTRRRNQGGVPVRVIEYTLDGVADAKDVYRLMTTILDPALAPARELAALYHERWEIENAFDELKTHLRGRQIVLRSKTPELVLQEFYGLLLAHFAVRGLMHEAALHADLDPDRLSFVHAVRVVRRAIQSTGSFSPSVDS